MTGGKLTVNTMSSEIIYASYRKINNEIKYLIRNSKKVNFINSYNEAKELQDKWNLIHKFGITAKARKNETRNIDIMINSHLIN